MPKVELHLHLEGSIRPQTALDLMKRNHVNTTTRSSDEVRSLYRFENLGEFVEGMRVVSDNLRHLDDLCRVTRELLQSLIEQNIRYVEFDCAVQKYIDLGFPLADIIDTLYACAQEMTAKHSFQAYLVVNLLRSHSPERALRLVEDVIALAHPFIVGIGLSGDENKYSPEPFREAFLLAKKANLHRTAHAGEVQGPESIWKAIRFLDVDRIDHGTNAYRDDSLVEYLIDHKIPLTQCLTSNLKLRVVKGIKSHPFGKFNRRGVSVTLNTDDPQVFGTSLTDEYLLAATAFDLDARQIMKIVLNGVEASFLKDEMKHQLREEMVKELKRVLSRVKLDKTHVLSFFESS